MLHGFFLLTLDKNCIILYLTNRLNFYTKVSMRKKENEIIDRKALEEILERSKICRIALCDAGQPYIIPVCFGYKDDTLYFHSAREGRKIEILRQNNSVCFECEIDVQFVKNEKACKWSCMYKSVIGFGTASFVEDTDEMREAYEVIMAHYSDGIYKFPEQEMKKSKIVKVDVHKMTGKQSND